jgi:hypothetical protein
MHYHSHRAALHKCVFHIAGQNCIRRFLPTAGDIRSQLTAAKSQAEKVIVWQQLELAKFFQFSNFPFVLPARFVKKQSTFPTLTATERKRATEKGS